MLLSTMQMHIPDGFLSLPVALLGWGLTLALLAAALRRIDSSQSSRQLPLMGVLAAFIFAAQAVNFPVAAGTSGHLIGGALAAILIGPWQGMLVMTAVVTVQALVFQDGGLLALGWNLFNMAAVSCFVGDLVYRWLRGEPAQEGRRVPLAAFLAGWISVMTAATATSLQLAASGTIALKLALPAMLGVHALIGIGEGLITAGAAAFLLRARPAAVAPQTSGRRTAYLLIGAGLALLLAPLASSFPDGLERVAERLAFDDRARALGIGLLNDYAIPGIGSPAVATILAVALGSALLAGVGWLTARALAGREG